MTTLDMIFVLLFILCMCFFFFMLQAGDFLVFLTHWLRKQQDPSYVPKTTIQIFKDFFLRFKKK